MTRPKWIFVGTLLLAGLTAQVGVARQAPNPQEVYELIRTNLAGLTDAQLQTAAVEGLVKALQPRVWLVGGGTDTNAAPAPPVLSKTSVFDGPVAYLRIGRVGEGLPKELASACAELARTNQLKGLVLDLRFADGADYAAAAATANLFVAKVRPLLDWGTGSAAATEKTNALKLPVAVLVNHQTAEAAEALAAVLRDVGSALVIGSRTAGRALVAEDFPLKNGQHLRIAKAGLKLGSGASLSSDGVQPDIQVAVTAADERAYWADPFKDLTTSASPLSAGTLLGTTNRTARRVLNEAELVRERREGVDFDPDSETAPGRAGRGQPVVRDPVLARALDLIKGLAVVRQLRQ